jgi:hypothetical protein
MTLSVDNACGWIGGTIALPFFACKEKNGRKNYVVIQNNGHFPQVSLINLKVANIGMPIHTKLDLQVVVYSSKNPSS